jgi:hypothetical protein
MPAGRVNDAVNQRKEKFDLETQNIPFTRMMRMREEGDGAWGDPQRKVPVGQPCGKFRSTAPIGLFFIPEIEFIIAALL